MSTDFFLYMCLLHKYWWMHAGTLGSQKRVWDPLKLGSPEAVVRDF